MNAAFVEQISRRVIGDVIDAEPLRRAIALSDVSLPSAIGEQLAAWPSGYGGGDEVSRLSHALLQVSSDERMVGRGVPAGDHSPLTGWRSGGKP